MDTFFDVTFLTVRHWSGRFIRLLKLLRELMLRPVTPIRMLIDQLRHARPVFESVLAPNIDVTPFVVLLMAFVCSPGSPSMLQIVSNLEHFIGPFVK
jgi:hypothetical protein